jgi:hypothetical protein
MPYTQMSLVWGQRDRSYAYTVIRFDCFGNITFIYLSIPEGISAPAYIGKTGLNTAIRSASWNIADCGQQH